MRDKSFKRQQKGHDEDYQETGWIFGADDNERTVKVHRSGRLVGCQYTERAQSTMVSQMSLLGVKLEVKDEVVIIIQQFAGVYEH